MKHFFYKISILITVIVLSNSCYKDKGNYDYSRLPDIKINVNDEYYVSQFETINIPTIIDFGNDHESDYEFQWRIWLNSLGNTPKKVISSTKDLSYTVTEIPGSYLLVLTCMNKKTGVKTYKEIKLSVSGVISEGWMVLHEKDGKTDFDLIMTPFISKRFEKDMVLTNLYESVNGERLSGRGVKISSYFALGRYQYVIVLTENDGVRLAATTMQKTYDFKTLMLDNKPLKPENYFFFSYYWCLGRGYEVLISDGRYYINETLGKGFTEPILKDGETYKTSKWGAKWLWTFKGMIYDELHGRFLGIQGTPLITATKLPEAIGRQFDWNNMNGTLLYMDTGFKHYDYALIKDWTTNEINLFVLNFDEKNNFDVAKYSAQLCPELDGAKFHAIGERGNVFYYCTDKDIYLYDYAGTKKGNKIMSTKNGEYITGMKILKPCIDRYIATHPYDNKVLILSTYNDASQEGKVYMYYVNESNGQIDISSEKVFTGFGKIFDMNYNYPKYGI
jgi:hypothetical protein